jgi:O-acetyl-ADP-ribose deacetylase
VVSFAIKSLKLEIADGDIAAQNVDAVVNAANNHFWMGSGVAGALKARGGTQIEAEAMALGPVDPGECVVTSGGRLPARYVIHAAVMGQNLSTSASVIERATRNVFRIAEEARVTSVALPALGTGVGGFPLADCARIMIGVVRAHESRTLRLVRFVLFGQAAYRAFGDVAGELLGTPLEGPPDCPISS